MLDIYLHFLVVIFEVGGHRDWLKFLHQYFVVLELLFCKLNS